jgi:hypothetical protein
MEQTHIKKRVKQPAINYACELCEFNTCKKCNFEAHLLTPKHFRLSEATKKGVNEDTKKPLECKDCNYICFTKYKLDRHLSTPKHKKKVDESTPIKKVYLCVCGKTYKHASSLCKHSHTCNPVIPAVSSQVEPTADNTILRLVEENRELTKIIIEQTRKFDEIIAKERETITPETTTHTTTTETTQNNISVNIRFLLNDKCYDAKQLIEFLTSNNETNLVV